MITTIEIITTILLLIVIGLLAYLFYVFIKKHLKPSSDTPSNNGDFSNCRCMRQTDGNKGFCGMCDSEGFRYGCSTGNKGCRRNCSKVKYSGNRCDSCRDSNCNQ